MTTAAPRALPRLRFRLRSSLLGLLVGVGIGLMMSLGLPGSGRFVYVGFGGLVGLGIALFSQLLTALCRPWLAGLAGSRRTLAQAVVFFVAGVAAYLAVGLLLQAALPGRVRPFSSGLLQAMAITGGLAIAVGLSIYSFERLRERLAESVARLKEHEYAQKELELARDLQRRLLPPTEIAGEGYRVAARNLPARIVAGDFYDAFRLGDGALGLVVADVAGKGMAAALIMASVKAVLPLLAAGRSAEATLAELNRKLARELSPREFVALAYARYDPANGTLALANAGLPDPYLVRPGEPPRTLPVPGPRLPLGVRREVAYGALQVRLEPGDRLLLLTDGLAEAPVKDGEPLGYAALAELLPGEALAPPVWLESLLAGVRAATGETLEDDWTALLLERSL